MYASFLSLGALFAALAVIMGAFGAHALKSHLDEHLLEVFHTGVEYQFYHALGLIALGVVIRLLGPSALFTATGVLLITGIVLFSGSLYVLSVSGIRWIGMITPVGGLSWIVAWLLFAVAAWRT